VLAATIRGAGKAPGSISDSGSVAPSGTALSRTPPHSHPPWRPLATGSQITFEHRRSTTLTTLADVELPDCTLRFIKDSWSKRRTDSLDRRLRDLIEQLPEAVRTLVSEPPGGDVLVALTADGAQPIEALLRMLRNELSHGNRNYDDPDLLPWVQVAETMCRAHALRLLGFDEDAVVAGLAPAPAPAAPAQGGDEPAQA